MSDTKTYTGLTSVLQALGAGHPDPRRRGRWGKVALASLSDVEELLDWLENSGYDERRVDFADGAFVVRWREDA